jgi:hypothetical protein
MAGSVPDMGVELSPTMGEHVFCHVFYKFSLPVTYIKIYEKSSYRCRLDRTINISIYLYTVSKLRMLDVLQLAIPDPEWHHSQVLLHKSISITLVLCKWRSSCSVLSLLIIW